jgi:hypothetical protein
MHTAWRVRSLPEYGIRKFELLGMQNLELQSSNSFYRFLQIYAHTCRCHGKELEERKEANEAILQAL